MKGMIDVLSNMKGGLIGDKWDSEAKASDYGAAILNLVTPANASVNQDLVDYATSKNVSVVQRFTQQDVEDPSRLRVAPGGTKLNKTAWDLRTTLPKPPGQSVYVNWHKR